MSLSGKIKARLRLVGQAREVKRLTGKPLLRQLKELVRLRLGPTHLTAREYYALRAWDETLYPQGTAGIGGDWLSRHIHARLNNKAWEVLMTDKLATCAVLEAAALPYPPIHATVSRGRRFGHAPNFATAEALADYLRRSAPYPLFVKPIKGNKGAGCWALSAYDPVEDRLLLGDGRAVDLATFLKRLTDPTGFGLTLQHGLSPHPEIRELTGSDAVAGCRVVSLLGDEGPRLFHVGLKLPSGTAMTDNFGDGTRGTTLVHVNRENGVLGRAFTGLGLSLRLVDAHPETGRRIVGRRLPDWPRVIGIIEHATLAFPGARWQSWDVGLTDRGPVLLELNSAGDVFPMNLTSGAGCLDAELRGFLERYDFPDDRATAVFPAMAGRNVSQRHAPAETR